MSISIAIPLIGGLGLIIVFLMIGWANRRAAAAFAQGTDLAPGWMISCPKCKHSRPLAEVGGVRIGGNPGAVKYTLGTCSRCGRLRFLRIHHEAPAGPLPVDPAP